MHLWGALHFSHTLAKMRKFPHFFTLPLSKNILEIFFANHIVIKLYFRGKHFCADKTTVTFKQKIFEYSNTFAGGVRLKTENHVANQLFPGFLDRGTPLIVKENGKNTVIGMFEKHLTQDPAKGPSLFYKLQLDTVHWIFNFADWTQDSNCNFTYTSCMCGAPPGGDLWR